MRGKITDYRKYGFKRSDIIDVLGDDFFTKIDLCREIVNNVTEINNNSDKSPAEEICSPQQLTKWEESFAGRKHALEIISVLSLLLVEKSGNKYRRGTGISANRIAIEVVSMLNDTPDPQQYRRLISEALNETRLASDDKS